MATPSRRKTDIPPEHQEYLSKSLEMWLSLWQMDGFASRIELKLSNRMTRTIGSANLTKNRITLAAWLFNQPQLIIDEVLCHEAAHLAVFALNGNNCRPHGREWQALMRRAGFIPRVRIPLPNPPPLPARRRRSRKTPFGRVAAALIRW